MKHLANIEKDKLYTYEDVEKGLKYEVIKGRLFTENSPNTLHQKVLLEIAVQLKVYLEDKPCEVFLSPLDVFFDKKLNKSQNFVKPDIFVVCNKDKIRKRGVFGAPDLVIEILSDANKSRDLLDKYNLYLENKVREYWTIDLEEGIITVNFLRKKTYLCKGIYLLTDIIKVNIFDDCYISISKLIEKDGALFLQEESTAYSLLSKEKEYNYQDILCMKKR